MPKAASLLQLVAEAKGSGDEVVLVHHPEVLGDDYAEVVESLNRIAEAELFLRILPHSERGTPDLPGKRHG
jgi:hypothetical protein